MKKILSLVLSLVVVFGIITPVNGQVDALTRAQNYWLNTKQLSGIDAILTVEALGLDVEDSKNGFIVDYDFFAPVNSYGEAIAYEDMDCGYLSKNIMALAAMKIDPAKLTLTDGSTKNLIEILKSKIDADGNVIFGSGNPESSTAYTMYALSIVEPDYDLSKLGAKLASMQLDDGCWGYNGSYGGPDITGWAIGALALCGDTFQSSIDKALAYFVSIQQADGAFVPNDGWGSVANSNTQGCVVWGLLEYDADIIKRGAFKTAYDSLMSFLLEDGSFAQQAGQDYGDIFATVQAGLALGVYENGSLFTNIRGQYEEMFSPQPETPQTVLVPEKVSTPTDEVVTSVKTGDKALIMASMFIMIVSGGIFSIIKKEF